MSVELENLEAENSSSPEREGKDERAKKGVCWMGIQMLLKTTSKSIVLKKFNLIRCKDLGREGSHEEMIAVGQKY